MIEICREDGKITIHGHAGCAPPGQDIVCAAVSALTETFIASVEELTADQIKSDISAGNAVIRYQDLSTDAQLLMKSFFIGIEGVAEGYPEYVSINY